MAVLGAPVVAFAWLAVAQALLGGAILLALSRGRAPGLRCWQVSRPDSIRLLREGWPLLAAALAAALGTRLDMVMLSKLAGPVPTGQYTAAVRLSELLQVVPTAIAVSVFPALIHARDTDLPGSRLGAFMQALYDLMAALGLAIAVPLSLLARPAATALYGSAYTASGPILAAHVWGFVFTCLGVARARWLLATRGTSLLLYTSLLGAGVNAGLNLLLIPRHGALGAAWAAVAAQAVATYVSCALWPALRAPFVQMSRALLLPLRLRSAWRGMVALWRDTAEPTIEPESSVV